MSNPLPLSISFGVLPNNGLGYSAQELTDLLGVNGRIFTEASFALFTTGATAPTSDTGPWAKNGNTWYYWDTGTGAYVPFIIQPESLGYYVGSATPDQNVYSFWIQLDGSGSPLALKTYFGGAWVDVYATLLASSLAPYSTTAQMTAAIAAAVAGVTVAAGQNIFKATPSGNQDIVHGAGGTLTTDVAFGTIVFDPDSDFGTSLFTAPANGYYEFKSTVQVSVPAGAATAVAGLCQFESSGGQNDFFNTVADEGTGQRFYHGSTIMYLTTAQTVKVSIDTTVDGACTVRIGIYSFFTGCRLR